MASGNTDPRTFVEVIIRGDVGGIMPRNKWSYIENALSFVYSKDIKEICGDAGWSQIRIKLISFENKTSVECYRAVLGTVGRYAEVRFSISSTEMICRPDPEHIRES